VTEAFRELSAPTMRRVLDSGFAGRLVYVMQADEILTLDELGRTALRAERCPPTVGPSSAYGANIYRHSDDGTWLQADSRHGRPDGKPTRAHHDAASLRSWSRGHRWFVG
jgi:hypothetical protein